MVSPEIERLLNALPAESGNPLSASQIVIDGHLLRGDGESVRIVTGDLALDIDTRDVEEVIEIPLPEGFPSSLAVPVSVLLKRGARLLGCSVASEYAPLLERPILPFAYAVRTSYPPMQVAPRFDAMEHAFRERHGL